MTTSIILQKKPLEKSNKKTKIDLSGSKPKPTENILKKSNSREKLNNHKINDVLKGASINNQVVIFDDIKTDKKQQSAKKETKGLHSPSILSKTV